MNMSSGDPVRIFVSQSSGPEEFAAFFEDTLGTEETPLGGYLYIKDCKKERIIRHLQIYKCPLDVIEDDIEIHWSSDGKKCGISVWGKMRGIVNVANGQEVSALLENRESPAITDIGWLNGFEDYLDQNQFIRARQRYWKGIAKGYDPNAKFPSEETIPLTVNFILNTKGPDDLFAVFEDDGKTGYLYLYDSMAQGVIEHLLIYDRSEKIDVVSQDVRVVWSEDGEKCGVAIWDKMRGIIDRVKKEEGRVKLESRDTSGISDQEWLKGFEYLYS